MRKNLALSVLACTLLAAGTAYGAATSTQNTASGVAMGSSPPAHASAAQARPGYNPNQVICKEQEAQIGSRFGGGSICHTRAQWDEMSDDSQQQLQKMQGAHTSGGQ